MLKKVINNILKVLGNIVLAIIGVALYWGLMPLAFVFGVFRASYKMRLLEFFNDFFFNIGYGHDQGGNAAYKEMLNGLMKVDVEDSKAFGNPDETVSSAMGRMQVSKKLSRIGWILNLILWMVDFKNMFKGGHSYNSIENDKISD